MTLNANIRVHTWEGSLAGVHLGLLHALLLGSGGLFVLVAPLETMTAVARYAAILGLAGASLGVVVGLVTAPAMRLHALTYMKPLRPAPLIAVLAYAGLWLVFLVDDRVGRHAVLPFAAAGAAVVGVFLLVVFVRALRVRQRPLSSIPGRGLVVQLIVLGLLYSSPFLLRSHAPPVDPAEATGGHRRPDVAAAFAERAAAFEGGRWNLLLLTIDTLRADHMSMYGYERLTTPVLDALAERGVRFDRVFCPRPKTSPSFATIMTGTWPARHGIHGAMQRLAADNETLAEYLRSAGWRTGAVITNGNLYPAFAFDQGFESYAYGHGGAEVAPLALDWLDANASAAGPWFLWVHYTNPHTPYSPPPPYDSMYGVSGSAHERQVQLYDGEIRYTDGEIGRILEWLNRNDQQDNTLIVFTADHGESLGEHDYYYAHGLHPYEPSARIPFVMSAPGVVPDATTNDALVAAVDILPTILDALGVAWTDDVVQGHSVLPLATGTVSESDREFVVIESGYGKHSESGQTIALRRASTKYVHRLRQWALRPQGLGSVFWTTNARFEGGLKPDELYDLDADPEELDNLLAERRAFSLEERELLRAYAAYLYATGRRSAENPGELDAETYESLKSLGYL